MRTAQFIKYVPLACAFIAGLIFIGSRTWSMAYGYPDPESLTSLATTYFLFVYMPCTIPLTCITLLIDLPIGIAPILSMLPIAVVALGSTYAQSNPAFPGRRLLGKAAYYIEACNMLCIILGSIILGALFAANIWRTAIYSNSASTFSDRLLIALILITTAAVSVCFRIVHWQARRLWQHNQANLN